ncbi:MAG: hypothetical protein ACLT98_08225 [Eggerthellaceae bacterium]
MTIPADHGRGIARRRGIASTPQANMGRGTPLAAPGAPAPTAPWPWPDERRSSRRSSTTSW